MNRILNAGVSRGVTLLIAPTPAQRFDEARPEGVPSRERPLRRLRAAAGRALIALGTRLTATGRRLAGVAPSRRSFGSRQPVPFGCG